MLQRNIFIAFLITLQIQSFCAPTNEETFTKIYTNGAWGAPWFSGDGSLLSNTRQYMEFLQKFLKDHDIKSVIDVGCGDWQFSQYIDWTNISYLGLDVVPRLMEKNRKLFGAPNITFISGDATKMDLPPADLLICKDVLQHLSNEDVQLFLRQLYKFKYCLIINDIESSNGSITNSPIKSGDWRCIDITARPFNIKGKTVYIYRTNRSTKAVILIVNSRAPAP